MKIGLNGNCVWLFIILLLLGQFFNWRQIRSIRANRLNGADCENLLDYVNDRDEGRSEKIVTLKELRK